MITRRTFLASTVGVLAAPLAAEAQEAGKVARIGVLNSGSPPAPFVESFKQGLRELGYVDGRNVSIEYRWAEGRDERLPGLAADLVRLKVDVIVASSQASEAAARSLGVRLQALKVERPDDFMTAFAEMQKNRAEALIVSSSGLFYVHRIRLVEFAAKHQLPTIYH